MNTPVSRPLVTSRPAARRSVRSFVVETFYSGPRQSYMALEPLCCERCGHRIPPGSHFTRGGHARQPGAAPICCYTCVPFDLPEEARQWLRPPVKPLKVLHPTQRQSA